MQLLLMGTILTFILDCAAETLARLLYVKQLGRTLESVYVALLISWGISWSPRFVSQLKTFLLRPLCQMTRPLSQINVLQSTT